MGDEQRLLAQTLASRDPAILFFKSANCSLCRALEQRVDLEATAGGFPVRSITTDDQAAWAPEMLRYGVETVPCFVALDSAGRAVAKSGKPRGIDHAVSSLGALGRLLARRK